MCGIAGVFLRDPNLDINLDKVLDTMLHEIDHRGGDATGFVAVGDDGVMEWQRASCDAKDFSAHRRGVPTGTRVLLAHTRWATQGLPAFMENNHPIRRGAFFIIHNGHVNNDAELFKQCGKQRFGEVDSEAIAARLSTRGTLTSLPEVMEEIEGMAAVAAVDERAGDRLSIARGYYSPMYVLETDKIVMFGSTKETVLDTYRKCIGTISEKRVTYLAEGTCIHYEGRERREVEFQPYKPPVQKQKPQTISYLDQSGRVVSFAKAWDWDDEEDYMDCDSCGTYVPWKDMHWEESPLGDGTTVGRCRECVRYDDWWNSRAGIDALDDDEPDVSDRFSFVNQKVLDAGRTSAYAEAAQRLDPAFMSAKEASASEEDWLNDEE